MEASRRGRGPASTPRIRCLLGMLGVDAHSKGIQTLATLLRDRGVEVVYIGEHNTAEQMVSAALAEDVDAVGVSFSTPTYVLYTAELVEKMAKAGLGDVPVMVGGLIHPEDQDALRAAGVKGIFPVGTDTDDVVEFLQRVSKDRLAAL